MFHPEHIFVKIIIKLPQEKCINYKGGKQGKENTETKKIKAHLNLHLFPSMPHKSEQNKSKKQT